MVCVGDAAASTYMIKHSLYPSTGKFIFQRLLGDQCQYSTFLPLRCQSNSTSFHNLSIDAANAFSFSFPFLKYSRTQRSPCSRKDVSTKSPPSSSGLKGFTLPVSPLSQCGHTP